MVILLKQHAPQAEQERVLSWLRELGAEVRVTGTPERPFFCLTGDISRIDPSLAARFPAVEDVLRLTEPYPLCSRRLHPGPTVVSVGEARFGGGHFGLIAGPCAVESEEQIFTAARQAKAAGVCLLRGGAFKPRTSPYDFSGLGAEGLRLLVAAGRETGLPVVSELMSAAQLDAFADVDVIQIGARNMQNYDLLRALGRSEKPVLLKRGIGATLQELLLSAEYLLAAGNPRVMLCERGIRTFDTFTRGTLDLAAVPALHEMTHLPVLVDPSHAAGIRFMVEPLAMAAIAAGADGLMIEVHNNPEKALCDGGQSLTPEMFDPLMKKVDKAADFFHSLG